MGPNPRDLNLETRRQLITQTIQLPGADVQIHRKK